MISKQFLIDKVVGLEKRLDKLEGVLPRLVEAGQPQIKWTKIGNLLWSESLGEMTWYEAKKKCEELGGRLPTRTELIDLFDNHYEELRNLLDPGNYFWSSTEYYFGTTNAWYVYLYDGDTSHYTKTDRNYIRCVCVGENKF